MKYELRVWLDAKKMPKSLTPEEAKKRLTDMANLTKFEGLARGGDEKRLNPDILIDADGSNQSPITSAVISYDVGEIKIKRKVDNKDKVYKKKITTIKMNIKGNLYLPLNPNAVGEAVAGVVGSKGDENKLRDTLLLSKWASVKPDAPKAEGYLRGVLLSILTKAGDFRLISANNMYVESYSEDYKEGEFGTFELKLAQQREFTSTFKVQGLSGEKQSVIDQIKSGVSKAAEGVAIAAATAKVAGAVLKKGVETYEKFNGGETEATRWLKFSADTASAAGGLTDAMQKKDYKAAGDTISERIMTGKDTDHALVPLDELEKLNLSWIKADPDRYAKYLKMSENEKRAELQKAADEKYQRITIDKNVTKEIRGLYGGDLSELEELYLDQLKKDPERYAKYLKMSDDEKMAELLSMALDELENDNADDDTDDDTTSAKADDTTSAKADDTTSASHDDTTSASHDDTTSASHDDTTSVRGTNNASARAGTIPFTKSGLSSMLGDAALKKTNGNLNGGGGNGSH